MQAKHPRPRPGTILPGASLALVALTALAGCAAQPGATQAGPVLMAAPATAAHSDAAVPGGAMRTGASTASMADQYRPRPGGTTSIAAGASAWVAPAPAPAFVLSGPLPPAAPPAPPLAAVANRPPAAAAPASEVVRPEAAAPAAAPAAPAAAARAPAAASQADPTVREQGLALFNNYSCNACHALADANASGSIGPSLDRNPRMTKAYAVDVITNGRGAMPAFGGQMTDEEIDVISEYIVQFARK